MINLSRLGSRQEAGEEKAFRYLAAAIDLKIQSKLMSAMDKVVVGFGLIQHFILYSRSQTLSGYRAAIIEENSWMASSDKNVTSLKDRGPM